MSGGLLFIPIHPFLAIAFVFSWIRLGKNIFGGKLRRKRARRQLGSARRRKSTLRWDEFLKSPHWIHRHLLGSPVLVEVDDDFQSALTVNSSPDAPIIG